MLGHDPYKRQNYPLGNPAYYKGDPEHDGGVEEGHDVLVVLESEDAQEPVDDLHDLFGDGV